MLPIKSFCLRAAARLSHLTTGRVEELELTNYTESEDSEGATEFDTLISSLSLVIQVRGTWCPKAGQPRFLMTELTPREGKSNAPRGEMPTLTH